MLLIYVSASDHAANGAAARTAHAYNFKPIFQLIWQCDRPIRAKGGRILDDIRIGFLSDTKNKLCFPRTSMEMLAAFYLKIWIFHLSSLWAHNLT